MRAVAQRIQGEQITVRQKHGLLLYDATPEKAAPDLLYLRYPFVTLGPESHVFPAFIMDDWGAEIKGLKLYPWFQKHAPEFPRAEIFGFEQNGTQTQRFVREFEHYVKYPCYLYQDRAQSVHDGVLLSAICLLSDTVAQVTKLRQPPKEDIPQPMRRANVTWWLIPASENLAELGQKLFEKESI